MHCMAELEQDTVSLLTLDNIQRRAISQFTNSPYLLSQAGEALRSAITRSESDENASIGLPTVEDPKPHLYADLKLTEGESAQIFGFDLANIQTTKGCRHRCEFCAAGALVRTDVMPYAAVVKIAERKAQYDRELEVLWTEYETNMKPIYDRLQRTFPSYREFERALVVGLTGPQHRRIRLERPEIAEIEEVYRLSKLSTAFPHRIFPGLNAPRSVSNIFGSITNYYDSDPFDYRSTDISHEDGTPANFGDVVSLLASEVRPIHITTAGWPITDRVAQRAAETIVSLYKRNPRLSYGGIRISVNPYELFAVRDFNSYCGQMLNVIRTLSPLGPQVLFFEDNTSPSYQEYKQKVIDPIEEFIRQLWPKDERKMEGIRLPFITEALISRYSGSLADYDHRKDHDVMACMPGYHILPNGSVYYQNYVLSSNDKLVEKGTRPRDTGLKIY